jgi:hypothetical protein
MRRIRQTAAATRFESLERRRLLAGNVIATATDPSAQEGTITLIGDNKSNQVEIQPTASGYLVTGLNGTTVNGVTSVTLHAAGLRNLVANMGNGDDDLQLQQNTFGGSSEFNSASIDMGNGNDTVEMTGAYFANFGSAAHGDLNINTGNGDDVVTITGSTVEGNLKVDLGNGDDTLAFVGSITVFGTSTLIGGHGENTLLGTPPAGSILSDF